MAQNFRVPGKYIRDIPTGGAGYFVMNARPRSVCYGVKGVPFTVHTAGRYSPLGRVGYFLVYVYSCLYAKG